MRTRIRVLTTEDDGSGVIDPVHLAVRQFRGFYEIVDMRRESSRVIVPEALQGKYTTERDAVDAIVRHLLPKPKPTIRKDGRPVFTPKGSRGRPSGAKNKVKKEEHDPS